MIYFGRSYKYSRCHPRRIGSALERTGPRPRDRGADGGAAVAGQHPKKKQKLINDSRSNTPGFNFGN